MYRIGQQDIWKEIYKAIDNNNGIVIGMELLPSAICFGKEYPTMVRIHTLSNSAYPMVGIIERISY